jgi:hypothetical protein
MLSCDLKTSVEAAFSLPSERPVYRTLPKESTHLHLSHMALYAGNWYVRSFRTVTIITTSSTGSSFSVTTQQRVDPTTLACFFMQFAQ